MSQPKVSIIIPVYRVENYIEKCVRTLFGQTLDDLEFIFIDDCSPDKSVSVMQKVLKEFPERKPQVKIIQHKTNKGVSQSRQDGVDAATGEYIIHCDPDDWVDKNMYESLYNKACETNSDIVICDFILESEGNIHTYCSQTPRQLNATSILESISGHKDPLLHGSTCNKLVKSKLYKQVIFPSDISFCEDVYIWFQILKDQINIVYINEPFYHYRQSNNSIIHTVSQVTLNKDFNLIKYLDELKNTSEDQSYIQSCESMIVNLLIRFFFYSNYNSRKFRQEFTKYRKYLKSNKRIGVVKKIFLFLSMKGYYTQVKIIYTKLSKILHGKQN